MPDAAGGQFASGVVAMQWKEETLGSVFNLDWLKLGNRPVDPYLIWFDFVGRKLVANQAFEHEYGHKLPLLLELHAPFDGRIGSTAEVPTVYHDALGLSGEAARFISARVDPDDLEALFANAKVKRFQLELSRIQATERHAPAVAKLPKQPAAYPEQPQRQEPSRQAQTWLGVIDIGCAFAHPDLCLAEAGAPPSTRVRYLWDQSPSPRAGNRARVSAATTARRGPVATKLGYGAEQGPVELDAAMAQGSDEAAHYAAVGNEKVLEKRAEHGFGVLDLLGGRPSPLVAGPPPLEGEPDAAGALPVVFVELDSFEGRVTNINSLGVHVLDGLRWMIDRVEQHPVRNDAEADPQAKLVVNISYGGLAGPHDGSSILERAIDELIDKRKNLFVVLAAGNSHDPDLPTHARLKVGPSEPGKVLWQVEPDDPTDGFLEVWFPAGVSVDENQVCIRVTAPNGSTSGDIVANQTWMLRAGDAEDAPVAAGAMFRGLAANGEESAMFLLAVQPTAPRSGVAGQAEAGLWKVEVACHGSRPMDVHAWLERDDYVSGNLKRKQQSALIDPGDKSVSLEYNLSSLAHGRHTIVAGGYCLSDGQVSDFTASGPSRGADPRERGNSKKWAGPARNPALPWPRRWPDVLAPSDEARATPGLLVAGATQGVFNRLSGTSAAAPSVARWIANWCAANPGPLDKRALDKAIAALHGIDPVPGAVPGPEVVPGSADEAFRRAPISLDARLAPALPTAEPSGATKSSPARGVAPVSPPTPHHRIGSAASKTIRWSSTRR
jgi:hypothetical protein